MPILATFQGFLASIGATVLWLCQVTGSLSLFAVSGVTHVFRPPWYPTELLRQFMRIGYFSLPVVGMTALFTGEVATGLAERRCASKVRSGYASRRMSALAPPVNIA